MKRTKIANDDLYYKKNFFSSFDGEAKFFKRSLEAINYAFPRTKYHLQKIIFQIVQHDISLQS